jgi:carboxymethylenebutenolidase
VTGEGICADDGFTLPVYRAAPGTEPKGVLVVAQEIFGLTQHVKSVCDRLAALGYLAVAPDLFARMLAGRQLPYTDSGKKEGLRIKNALGEAALARDLEAVARAVAPAQAGRIGLVGFCLGGTLAWLLAAKQLAACVVAYYPVRIEEHLARAPECPVLLHFGKSDPSISRAAVLSVRAAWPAVEVHEYDAGHAFNRDDDKTYDAASAEVAWRRTAGFLRRHLENEAAR